MSQEPILETKYPDTENLSRAQRDMIIFQTIEKLANEVERLRKEVQIIKDKI